MLFINIKIIKFYFQCTLSATILVALKSNFMKTTDFRKIYFYSKLDCVSELILTLIDFNFN